ncbi:MAG: alpha/beta fold hydrolase, partial [Dehalococcoidia bacterium]
MPHIEANGLNIFYREVGRGEPCLLLQGFTMDHRGWALQIPALRDHCRCISIDNRDVGQSDLAPGPYGVADMAADALGVLDALGIRRAHLVGHSLGGAIAQEIAIAHPQRVHRLVLISTYVAMGPLARAICEARKLAKARLTQAEYYAATFPWIYSDADYAVPGQVEAILQLAAANPNPQPCDAFCRQCDAV